MRYVHVFLQSKMEMFLGVNGETKVSKSNHKSRKDDKQKSSWIPHWMLPSSSTAPDCGTSSKNKAEVFSCAAAFTTDADVS